jgi:hypothetical protein
MVLLTTVGLMLEREYGLLQSSSDTQRPTRAQSNCRQP